MSSPIRSERSARPDARAVYLTMEVTAALAGQLAFVIAPLYRIRTAHLTPAQLVLVGTCMEAAVFLCEVPTGVVADVVSRRLSIIIGHLGMGLALVAEGLVPSVTMSIAAQVAWGASYTFTSGATQAWLAGEVGDGTETLTPLFLRVSRYSQFASIVAVPASFALGSIALRIPLLLGGAVSVALGLWLIVVMPETGFDRTPAEQRSTWHKMRSTTRDGLRAVRASTALMLIALLASVSGGSSEAYDRLWEAQLLHVGLPHVLGLGQLTWFALLSMASSGAGIVLTRYVERRGPGRDRERVTRWLLVLLPAQVVGLLLFGLAGSFAMAAVATLVVERARRLQAPLVAAWVIPITPRAERATVLSALGQSDAIGQVVLGPVLGVIASRLGLPAAIVTSAVVLAPGWFVLRAARRAR
jgi:DHA3 family tetracycline resistance protein-like MFS transporter